MADTEAADLRRLLKETTEKLKAAEVQLEDLKSNAQLDWKRQWELSQERLGEHRPAITLLHQVLPGASAREAVWRLIHDRAINAENSMCEWCGGLLADGVHFVRCSTSGKEGTTGPRPSKQAPEKTHG